MSNTIVLTEPQVDTLMQTWTGLQLERGVSSTNIGSFQVIAQIPYVVDRTQYTYVDASGSQTDWYRVIRYAPGGIFGTYTQPWPVAPLPITSGAGARRSLKNLRRTLARKMGSLQVVTTTADGGIDGDSIVSSNLATQIDDNRYRSWWIMPTDGVSAGQIRVIGEKALNPTSGLLSFQPPMLSQIVRGTQVEMHKLLPPTDSVGAVMGLREALNLALAECWVPDRLSISTTGSVTYDLEALGDWLDPAAIYELYGPAINGIPLQPFGGYVARGDAEQVDIDVIGLAAGTSATVELTRPGDTYIKIGGTWTDGQLGLTNDDDECLFQPAFITEVAKVYCYEALANSTTGAAPQARYQKLAEEQRRTVNIMKWRMLQHLPERSHGGYSIDSQDWMGWLK